MNGISMLTWQMEGIEKVRGNNMIFMSSDSIEQSIRVSNPSIHSIRVKKNYP